MRHLKTIARQLVGLGAGVDEAREAGHITKAAVRGHLLEAPQGPPSTYAWCKSKPSRPRKPRMTIRKRFQLLSPPLRLQNVTSLCMGADQGVVHAAIHLAVRPLAAL